MHDDIIAFCMRHQEIEEEGCMEYLKCIPRRKFEGICEWINKQNTPNTQMRKYYGTPYAPPEA
jgi:hypothetical protein